jgi:lipoprotein NlpI
MLGILLVLVGPLNAPPADPPFPPEKRSKLRAEFALAEQALTKEIDAGPRKLGLYSQRGDIRFFLGKFPEAAADYDAMVRIDPTTEKSHWRRGIALYYAGDYDRSARQFELYHDYDDIDRENGIWRYLAQSRASGLEKARAGLLEYSKDDRPPLPDLYAMFAGKLTPEEVLQRIQQADITDSERDKRQFYADLYIGLDAATRDDKLTAEKHLRQAVANPWGQEARGGPGYMWQVARVHWELLALEVRASK